MPLSPIRGNLFIDKFEKKALELYSRLKWWNGYVEDFLVSWSHGRPELEMFLNRLNSLSEHIKSTIEVEDNDSIPFVDVLIKKQDDFFAHGVLQKEDLSKPLFEGRFYPPPISLSRDY